MSQGLIVLDEAEEELIEAEHWYERQLPGLGRAFRTAIDDGMERLVKAPHAASPIVNLPAFIGARRILVKRFPYSIVFIEQGGDLWVVAFAHQHRRPDYWRERL